MEEINYPEEGAAAEEGLFELSWSKGVVRGV